MSATVRTLADHDNADAPFFHTFPLWVLDALEQRNLKAAHVTEIKTMAKTADVTLALPDGNVLIKVRRSDAFPGRQTV